ncbi:alpha-soluble NSF attachment protein-like isoform X1 [Mangifera indica]|uniref:alpha-soluble NSF attachment protein-like isoform X1 n=1 Tax=Mangifera indica TaxID=29780 RepID=UPI001CFA65C6|nr:alpha-soluble NSF attachment protein-like isoform X1 [Mangifera indica]XP_044481164.1 alpha-soluble NSF attachment protein-like isoform X1 [Mangifera indica]
MSDHLAKAQEFEKKAEKKIKSWSLFGSRYDDAAELYAKSANHFKLAKSWDRAGSLYVILSDCHLKSDNKHEAAIACVDAANCYKKTSNKGAISCLDRAVSIFLDIGRFSIAARYCKDIGELYELEQNNEKAILYFERASEYFENAEATTSANQCKLKVAQFSAQQEQYQKAIEIYEKIARQSLNINLLKYGVRGHLLNAGLCQLCRGDVVAITNALERYENLDLTFSRTREYKFLADLATTIEEEDVTKFTHVVREFDSITRLDPWKTTLLWRVKEALKAKELEEDDLT